MYALYIIWLPKFGNYQIRQLLERLPDGAQTNRLVKVPNDKVAEWDAQHDEHGDVIDPATGRPVFQDETPAYAR